MRNCACAVGVHCRVAKRKEEGVELAVPASRPCVTSQPCVGREGEKKRASDVRLAGSDYVVALGSRGRGSWERGAVGIVREGRWAVRGYVAGLKRHLLRGLDG
jgi:hypothetical protein